MNKYNVSKPRSHRPGATSPPRRPQELPRGRAQTGALTSEGRAVSPFLPQASPVRSASQPQILLSQPELVQVEKPGTRTAVSPQTGTP